MQSTVCRHGLTEGDKLCWVGYCGSSGRQGNTDGGLPSEQAYGVESITGSRIRGTQLAGRQASWRNDADGARGGEAEAEACFYGGGCCSGMGGVFSIVGGVGMFIEAEYVDLVG